MIVVLSDNAEADLESVGDFIALDSPDRAVTYVLELREACDHLGDMPRAFPLLDRHRRSGVRKRVYDDCLIFYTVTGQVNVIHVIHGSRNWEAIVFPKKPRRRR